MKKVSIIIIALIGSCAMPITAQRLYEINNAQQIPVLDNFYGTHFKKLPNGNIIIAGIDTSTNPSPLDYNFGKVRAYDDAMNFLGVEKTLPNGNTDQCCSSRPTAMGATSANDIIVGNLYKVNLFIPDEYHLYKFDNSSSNPVITKNFYNTIITEIMRGDDGISHALVVAAENASFNNNDWSLPYDYGLGGLQLFLVAFEDSTLNMVNNGAVLVGDHISTFDTYEIGPLNFGKVQRLSNDGFLLSYSHHVSTTSFKILNAEYQTVGVVNTIENNNGGAIEDPNTGNIIVSDVFEKKIKVYDSALSTEIKVYNFDPFSFFVGQQGFRDLHLIENEFAFGGLPGEMTLLDKNFDIKHFNSGTNVFYSGGGYTYYPFDNEPNASIFISSDKYNLYFTFFGSVLFRNMTLPNGTVANINVQTTTGGTGTAVIPLDVSYVVEKIPAARAGLAETINYYNSTLTGEPSDFVSIIRYVEGYDFSQIEVRDDFNDPDFDPVPSELYNVTPETYPLGTDPNFYPWFELDENGYFFKIAVKTEDIFVPSAVIDQVLYKKIYLTDFTNLTEIDDDGDGVLNAVDPDPNDPCVPTQDIGYSNYDYSNPIWKAADCDNDTFTNEEEWICGSDPYNPESDCSLGTAETYSELFTIHPNPTSKILKINSDSRFPIDHIVITNIAGQFIFQTAEKQIDVSSLQAGMYFLKIQTERGTVTKKFIKE